MSDIKFPCTKSPNMVSTSIKLPIKKSPTISPKYVSTKIVHSTNIALNYDKYCCSPHVDSKLNLCLAAKNQPNQTSGNGIQGKCVVYVSKSERNGNTRVVSIKSTATKVSNGSEISDFQKNSVELLKHPRVEALQSINTSKENVTPKDSLPLKENKIKVDHKSSKKVKEVKSAYLDRNLAYNEEYRDDFIQLQLELDKSHKLSPTFLTKTVSAVQRQSAIKEVLIFAAESNYSSHITFQSVKISDAVIDLKNTEDLDLELINLSALWISLKRLHPFNDIPSIKKLIKGDKGQEKLFYDYEKDILKTLDFEISFPDPISMVVLCLKNVDHDYPYEIMYYTALYLIDLSLLNEYFSQISVSCLVIATAQISLFTAVKGVENMKHPPWHFWRAKFPKMLSATESVPDIMVESIRKKLIRMALLSQNPESDYALVFKKYKASRFGKVSKLIAKRLNSLLECEYE